MNKSLTFVTLAQSVWQDFRRTWGALFVFEAFFKILEAWLLVPTIALLLTAVLARAGHVAVSNLDIVDFLLTPHGLIYAALWGIVAVSLLLIEQAGIMVVVDLGVASARPPLTRILRAALGKALSIFQVGAIKLTVLALTFAPFVLLGVLIYRIFLSAHDIYFYWNNRPPAFWLAAGIGGTAALAALAIGMYLFVRWAFVLPILLFERPAILGAFAASRDRIRGVAWRVGLALLGWQLAALTIGVALEAGFRLSAASLLDNAGERPVLLIALLLLAKGGLVAAISFVRSVVQGLLTRQLYLQRNNQLGLPVPERLDLTSATTPLQSRWVRRLLYLAVVLIMLAPLTLSATLLHYALPRTRVQVTAHRGHARIAPENTLSAIRKAIASGADYAEIDVQQTADGVIVLLHDRDLMRVAGDPRRLADITYDQVRKLDVGKWFSPDFADERVPTLEEVMELSRGRIKLHIELKSFGAHEQLARDVARLVREQKFESACFVAAFSYEAIRAVRRENPNVRTGLTVAHALGELNWREFDVLSVWMEFLSNALLREAHQRGREVHVWTVNDPRQMAQLIKQGVDNIMTSDPDTLIRVRKEWDDITPVERLVLASRLLLGID